jgi:hypothetical protein
MLPLHALQDTPAGLVYAMEDVPKGGEATRGRARRTLTYAEWTPHEVGGGPNQANERSPQAVGGLHEAPSLPGPVE